MEKSTDQMQEWSKEFGRQYTDRNLHTFDDLDTFYLEHLGITRSSLNWEFLNEIDRFIRILEIGANVGIQLQGLQKMGFENLYGIELQADAIELAKTRTKDINFIQGTVFDIPFKDGFFDLVFTSGLLIHISPDNIDEALDEIFRCSNQYTSGVVSITPTNHIRCLIGARITSSGRPILLSYISTDLRNLNWQKKKG